MPKDLPRSIQEASGIPCLGLQELPRSTQGLPRNAPELPRSAPDLPRSSQGASLIPPNPSLRFVFGNTRLQDGSPRAPMSDQETPKQPPHGTQETFKAPSGHKGAPKRPKEPPRANASRPGGMRAAFKSAATRRVGACLNGSRNLSNSELRAGPRIPPAGPDQAS